MGLIDLIVLACAVTNPSACHEYHVLLNTATSPQACTLQAQPYLAQWAGEHPAYRVMRWRCAWPDQEDSKI